MHDKFNCTIVTLRRSNAVFIWIQILLNGFQTFYELFSFLVNGPIFISGFILLFLRMYTIEAMELASTKQNFNQKYGHASGSLVKVLGFYTSMALNNRLINSNIEINPTNWYQIKRVISNKKEFQSNIEQIPSGHQSLESKGQENQNSFNMKGLNQKVNKPRILEADQQEDVSSPK